MSATYAAARERAAASASAAADADRTAMILAEVARVGVSTAAWTLNIPQAEVLRVRDAHAPKARKAKGKGK